MSFTTARRPIRPAIDGTYRAAAVARHAPTSAAVAQWTLRSGRSKRSTRSRTTVGAASGGGVVGAAIAGSHPGVDVVAPLLPEPGHDRVHDLDAAQPLDRLVAVHRGHQQPDRPAVGRRDG